MPYRYGIHKSEKGRITPLGEKVLVTIKSAKEKDIET
jgi:hypothetical protein